MVGIAGVIAFTFGLKAKSLSDQINGHNINQPWPSEIDGVPINEWPSQGAAWNRDTYIFAIGGGVAIAAGIGLFVYGWNQNDHGKPTERVSIVPDRQCPPHPLPPPSPSHPLQRFPQQVERAPPPPSALA